MAGMDEKISLEAISLYGDSFSEKLIRNHFLTHETITGEQILQFCGINQVNLFIVRELFKAWKEEMRKLRSPFFDYENQVVKDALEEFMAILSRHIVITRQNFTPLVKKAVSQALLVIFDPYDYYAITISGVNNKLDVVGFREDLKYLKVNKAPLEKLLSTLESRGYTEISGNEAFGLLDEILEVVNFTPEDVEAYHEQFSEIEPLDPAKFYVSKNPEYKAPTVRTPAPAPTPIVATPEPTPKAANTPRVVNQQTEQKTLIDKFQKITKIKDSLTINQKFMFTKVLFHGDFELFSKAVDRIDMLDSLSAALNYIEAEYADTWDRESEEFHEFMELVEKRFV